MIAIVDYGMGNIHSVNKGIEICGAKAVVTNNPEDIRMADKIVLPGVGAFSDAMQELEKQGLVPVLKEEIKKGKPFLGICLGMQLLFEESEEAKQTKGLGVLKGRVRRFAARPGMKVPHMGWNQLKQLQAGCSLLKNIPEATFAYFCHSYYPEPKDNNVRASVTDYGIDFASTVWQGNLFGTQFHPEKSQSAGLLMLKNFINLC